MTDTASTRVDELVRLLDQYSRRYYVEGVSEVSDEEYDRLYRELVDLERAHPELVRADSPTRRVGAPLPEGQGFEKVEHAVAMLSIESLFGQEEVLDFVEKIQRFLGLEESEELVWQVEPKFDGVSASLLYEEGLLTRGVTRGDGRVGEDVTANLRTVRNVPLRLAEGERPVPKLLEVRGEVLIARERFERFNAEREAQGRTVLANPRNATAGALRRNDPAQVARYPLEFHLYSAPRVEGAGEFATWSELLAALRAWGLPDSGYGEEALGMQACIDYHDRMEERREELPFEVDGVVCKLDDLELRGRLGATARATRWQYAHKFAAVEAVSTLRAVEVQVGANGRLTPRAHVDPAAVMGVTVRHATLHNFHHLASLGIKVGDRVFIRRAGDVIPQITGVAAAAKGAAPGDWQDRVPESLLDSDGDVRPGVALDWREVPEAPASCPSCEGEVVEEGKYLRCANLHGCRPQLVGRTLLMAGRGGFEIDTLGEKMVEQLFEAGYLTSPADLFLLDRLPKEQLVDLERWGEKSVDNLLAEIESAREVSLERFLAALAIPDVGPATARLLATHLGGLDAISAASEEELVAIDGIGPKVAQELIDWFEDERSQAVLESLLGPGRVRPQAPDASLGGALEGKVVVFTGTLSGLTRAEAKKLVEERGGRVSSSVSKKTDYLVVGGKPGSKAKKAEEAGVEVLLEEAFLELMGEE